MVVVAALLQVPLLVLGLVLSTPALASPGKTEDRPRIGLVLSGGGARGLAHIGVLQVLEELRVPVDIVVGASFGALVGGAYASGADVADLDKLVVTTDWASVLQDRPPRDQLSYRRRQDDVLVSSRLEFGVTRGGLALPRSAFSSAEVEKLLRQMAPASAFLKVEDLPLTYRAVATDMLTGETVVPIGVPLFTAMRASMTVPGAFTPITVEGRILGDGGLVSNLPVQLARDLGAEVIIAVNLGTPLGGPESIASALGMAQQMISILTEQNVQQSLRELRSGDVLIVPDLKGQDFMDFAQVRRTIAAGAAAARAQAASLKDLAMGADDFSAHAARRTQAHLALTRTPPVAGAVRVETTDAQGARVAVPHDPAVKPGDPLTPAALSAAAKRLQREVEAERVDAVVTGDGASRDVVLLPIASPFGLSRSRLGLELESDFDGTSQFTLSGLYTLGGLNAWGGEWRSLVRIGAVGQLQTEWHQPLGTGSPWFADLRIGYRAGDVPIYDEFKPTFLSNVRSAVASAAVGRRVGEAGQFRLGVQRRRASIEYTLPADAGESFKDESTSAFYELSFDTLDTLGYPTRGYLFSVTGEYFKAPQEQERGRRGSSMRMDGLYALASGDWSGHAYAAGLRSSIEAPVQQLSLGGFLRLSGAPLDSIFGDEAALGRAVVARRVGTLPALAGGAVRIGASLEAGRARGNASVPDGNVYHAGSLFAQADTRFGPAYLALGSTRGVGTSIYLFLGSVLLPSGILR